MFVQQKLAPIGLTNALKRQKAVIKLLYSIGSFLKSLNSVKIFLTVGASGFTAPINHRCVAIRSSFISLW